MTPYSEMQIRDRAYALWEAAGSPEGQDKEFWAMAEQELSDGQQAGGENEAERLDSDPIAAAVAGGLPTR